MRKTNKQPPRSKRPAVKSHNCAVKLISHVDFSAAVELKRCARQQAQVVSPIIHQEKEGAVKWREHVFKLLHMVRCL